MLADGKTSRGILLKIECPQRCRSAAMSAAVRPIQIPIFPLYFPIHRRPRIRCHDWRTNASQSSGLLKSRLCWTFPRSRDPASASNVSSRRPSVSRLSSIRGGVDLEESCLVTKSVKYVHQLAHMVNAVRLSNPRPICVLLQVDLGVIPDPDSYGKQD